MAVSSRRAQLCPGCAKPVRDRAAPSCRFCGTDLGQQEHRCTTCDGKAPASGGRCPHCGTPDVARRSADTRVSVCGRCGSRTATDAAACTRCGGPPPKADAPVRPADEPPAQIRLGTVTLAAPLADLDAVKARQATRVAPTVLERMEAEVGPTISCPVCTSLMPAAATSCPRCHFDRTKRGSAEMRPAAATHAVLPVKIAVTALLCVAMLGGHLALRRSDDQQADSQRILAALGPGASQADVVEIRRQAAALTVEAETLATLRRICFLRPKLAFSDADLQTWASTAPAQDRDTDLLNKVHTRCGNQRAGGTAPDDSSPH